MKAFNPGNTKIKTKINISSFITAYLSNTAILNVHTELQKNQKEYTKNEVNKMRHFGLEHTYSKQIITGTERTKGLFFSTTSMDFDLN